MAVQVASPRPPVPIGCRMFQVKICGITCREDAVAAVEAGADAIGLNFYPGSPRHVAPSDAAEIAAGLPGDVAKVGVFVDADVAWQRQVAEEVGLDWLQLHGDEPPQTVNAMAPFRVLRAFRLGSQESALQCQDYLADCRQLGSEPDALLFDAFAPNARGGTGKELDIDLLEPLKSELQRRPWVLAGGLTADNVADAIHQARPVAVDVASGVEAKPGRKDATSMSLFVAAARSALQRSQLSNE